MKHNNEEVIKFIEEVTEKELTTYQKEVIGTLNEVEDLGIELARGSTKNSITDLYFLYKIAVSVMEKGEIL